MQVDRFTKALLLAIAILLLILVVKPVFESRDSYAEKNVKYKVISDLPSIINGKTEQFLKGTEIGLNKYGAEGWELIYYDNEGWAILVKR
jgi:hypothetical protein